MLEKSAAPNAWLGRRLSFYYIAYFSVIGIQMPFWPVWLSGQGLDARAIGDLVTVSIVARIIITPSIAYLADIRGERKRLIVALGVLSLCSFALFYWAHSFWSLLLVSLIFYPAFSGSMPLTENLTMTVVRTRGLDYGRIRLWGSVSFIVLAYVTGRVLVDMPNSSIFWLMLASIAVLVLSGIGLPDVVPERMERARTPLRTLLSNRPFVTFLVATTFIQASHGVYYVVGTLHWQSVGYSDDVIGALWGEGVVAEVLLFLFSTRIVRRLSPVHLIMLAGLGGVIRWTLTGMTDHLTVIVIAQLLHALTYASIHIGAMNLIARTIPPSISATAQSLYSALAMGLGTGIATFTSGRLYTAMGSDSYFVMSVLAGLGAITALMIRPKEPMR